MHGRMVIVHCCIILHQVNTSSLRLNMDNSCTSDRKNNNKNNHENAHDFGL